MLWELVMASNTATCPAVTQQARFSGTLKFPLAHPPVLYPILGKILHPYLESRQSAAGPAGVFQRPLRDALILE
jgi:hypothetical protein